MDNKLFLLAFKRPGDMRKMRKDFLFADVQGLGKIADIPGIILKKVDYLTAERLRHKNLCTLAILSDAVPGSILNPDFIGKLLNLN